MTPDAVISKRLRALHHHEGSKGETALLGLGPGRESFYLCSFVSRQFAVVK